MLPCSNSLHDILRIRTAGARVIGAAAVGRAAKAELELAAPALVAMPRTKTKQIHVHPPIIIQ
jgi:hypothetical protein